MHIEIKKISELHLNEQNPRRNDHVVPYLVKSIEQFGFNNPVLIDKHNKVIAGHTRIKAAAKLEMDEVPTIMLEHLSPGQAKAYMIADNKLNEIADWDNDILKGILDELPPTIDIEALGFTQAEIDALIDFKPDLPDEDQEKEIKPDFTVIVTCKDEDEQQELFLELRDRGLTVK